MFGALKKLFAQDEPNGAYIACVTQARHPYFYTHLAVPDSLDGRFEMIVLHVCLLLVRMQGRMDESAQRALVEAFFEDMERNIREFGIDMGMKKRIRAMADAYAGRLGAYEAALATAGNAALENALARNVYAGCAAPAATLAAYARSAAAAPDQAAALVWPDPSMFRA